MQASRLKSSKETSFNLTDSSQNNEGTLAEDPLFTLKNSVCMFTEAGRTPNMDDILDSNLKLRQQELFRDEIKSPRTVTFGHVEYMNELMPKERKNRGSPRDASPDP